MGSPFQGSAIEAQLPVHHCKDGSSPKVDRKRLLKRYLLLLLSFVFFIYFGLHSTIAINLVFPGIRLAPSAIQAPKHPCVSTTSPISVSEYQTRQLRLAEVLRDLGGAAYVAEPGAQTQFFANFSSVNWKLSERPLLVIITPQPGKGNDDVRAEVSVLTPKFEATRAKLLPIPTVARYIEWAEEEDPYIVAVKALGLVSSESSARKIYIDNSARHLHYDGFQRAVASSGVTVTSATREINQLRERKSVAEIEILKCVNEATLLAIRHVHKKMYMGIRESEAQSMMSIALTEGGLSSGGCLTLFGENAALPHGSGTDRALKPPDFALFDCTAALYGYWSDITRTVAIPSSRIAQRQLDKWDAVRQAQKAAILAARSNVTARTIDKAARSALYNSGGLDKYFTHRLGHGIGLEVHEPPYLNGGSEEIIQPGHTFSDEPGIYIEGEVGVRLEDCFFIDNKGEAVYLTAGVGGPSKSPYSP